VARTFALVALALALAACAREPLPEICPNVEPGTLVIAELRGNNEAAPGDWIEIHNASTSTVDLLGLVVRVRLGGGTLIRFLIRESVDVPPGGQLAIGPEVLGDWVGYVVVEHGNLFGEEFKGFVELEGCDDELLDEVEFAGLPLVGTLACGNAATPPDIDTNDNTSTGCWCLDEGPGGAQGLVGFGTPGEPNRCP
jgi:hypothetical protein